MEKFYSIAIDGPSGAGKSSLAKAVAKEFGFIYVDTGAIYRTVGLAAFRAGIDRKSESEVGGILPALEFKMGYNAEGEQRMYLNGEDVSTDIRMPEISMCASDVSALPVVRAYLLEMQRKLARENNVIMDGRDIGTVVLPDADLKIFLTASAEARADRRMKQLELSGVKADYDEVLRDIIKRDEQDMNRAAAPLREAVDAVHADTTELNKEESFALLCDIIINKLSIETEDKN